MVEREAIEAELRQALAATAAKMRQKPRAIPKASVVQPEEIPKHSIRVPVRPLTAEEVMLWRIRQARRQQNRRSFR